MEPLLFIRSMEIKLASPQIIYGTPKLKYPFDRNGNWHFPSAAMILSYRKYDGTNIFMYRLSV